MRTALVLGLILLGAGAFVSYRSMHRSDDYARCSYLTGGNELRDNAVSDCLVRRYDWAPGDAQRYAYAAAERAAGPKRESPDSLYTFHADTRTWTATHR